MVIFRNKGWVDAETGIKTKPPHRFYVRAMGFNNLVFWLGPWLVITGPIRKIQLPTEKET